MPPIGDLGPRRSQYNAFASNSKPPMMPAGGLTNSSFSHEPMTAQPKTQSGNYRKAFKPDLPGQPVAQYSTIQSDGPTRSSNFYENPVMNRQSLRQVPSSDRGHGAFYEPKRRSPAARRQISREEARMHEQ